MKSVLIIDDSIDYREITANLLVDQGYDVWEASSPVEAINILKSEKFDLVICDLHMPFTSDDSQEEFVFSYEVGIKTIQELKNIFPNLPIIAMSSTTPIDLKRIARFIDPVPMYSKPTYNERILELVDFHLDQTQSRILQ